MKSKDVASTKTRKTDIFESVLLREIFETFSIFFFLNPILTNTTRSERIKFPENPKVANTAWSFDDLNFVFALKEFFYVDYFNISNILCQIFRT